MMFIESYEILAKTEPITLWLWLTVRHGIAGP